MTLQFIYIKMAGCLLNFLFLSMSKVKFANSIMTMDNQENEKNMKELDWFDKLSNEQQKDVLEGLAEADSGETIPHAEVVKIFRKWGLK